MAIYMCVSFGDEKPQLRNHLFSFLSSVRLDSCIYNILMLTPIKPFLDKYKIHTNIIRI